MKFLIDMNLSPGWTAVLEAENVEAVHWSSVGKPNAPDEEIMNFASKNDYAILAHDLDFGTMPALTQATSQNVLQVRAQDILPKSFGNIVINFLQKYREEIEKDALIVFD